MLLLLLVVFVSFVSPCDFSAKSLFVGCETWEKDTRNFLIIVDFADSELFFLRVLVYDNDLASS